MDKIHNQRLDFKYQNFCRYSDIMAYQYIKVIIKSKNGYINDSLVHRLYFNCFIATQFIWKQK